MKLNPEVYLEAAELIDDYKEHYMCFAIDKILNKNNKDYNKFFTPVNWVAPEIEELVRYFKPKNAVFAEPWGNHWDKDHKNTKQAQDCRVIALLFMYELTSGRSYHDPNDPI